MGFQSKHFFKRLIFLLEMCRIIIHWKKRILQLCLICSLDILMEYIGSVMVLTTAQYHSTKPELRFCTGSNPARGGSEICNDEVLWQWSPAGNKTKGLFLINHTTKKIHHLIKKHVKYEVNLEDQSKRTSLLKNKNFFIKNIMTRNNFIYGYTPSHQLY